MVNSGKRVGSSKRDPIGEKEPFKCRACKSCYLYVTGPMIGTCLYGGPFSAPLKGADMKDKDNKIDPK